PRALEGEWSAFELDLAPLFEHVQERVQYEDVVTYPAVRQDLAFTVAEDVPAGALIEAAREAAGPELREIEVFDVYRGEQVGEGRKSIAFRVAFQSSGASCTATARRGPPSALTSRLSQSTFSSSSTSS